MEAKSIATITADGKFELNICSLTEILHNLKCRDLAIVSMAGVYRTGKSFMLNFFIRYLREKGWENKDWFGPDNMKIQDGFKWKNGSKAHTLGIFVCPEIFYVKKNGEKVGVLIVDTQGLFDSNSSPDTNVNLMSISALLSSHQILNFQRKVCGTDLEHLQLSLEYALAASRSFPVKEKSFQKLTFLVRDWPNPDEHKFGQGGDEYIDGILKNIDPIQQVKKSIHSGFEHVNGFLMCRPNEKIDVNGTFEDLQNSDITGSFREHIIMLVDSVLNPKNLVVKKMFGQPISANGLINLISEVSNNIKSGKQPKIETLLESTIKANNATALQEAVLKYRCLLKRLVASSLPTDDVLRIQHEKAIKQAEKVFYSMATIGTESQNKDVWNHVEEECKTYYEFKKEEIRLRKATTRKSALEKAPKILQW
ncbi:atlastin-1-like [Styela clava]